MALSALVFCNYFACWKLTDWSRPWCIDADVPLFCGYFQAVSEGQAPIFPGSVKRLNAPFGAEWFDFPTTEVLVYAYGGLLTKVFDFVVAYNLCVATAHLLALFAFYWSARAFASSRWPAALTACAWANSRFLYVRDTIHINLSFQWHLPLLWWSCWRLKESRPLSDREKFFVGLTCMASGWQHPYYCFFALLMFSFTLLSSSLAKNWLVSVRSLKVLFLTGCFLSLAQVDTLTGWWQKGRSAVAFERPLSQLIYYGLRVPELFLPPVHRVGNLAQYAQSHYYSGLGGIAGETDSSYFGFLGVAGLLILLCGDLLRLSRGQPVSYFSAMIVALYAVAVAGGFNLMLGTLGVTLFRCGSRFSVLLLAGSLLYLSRWLSQRLLSPPLAVTLMILSCLDSVPPPPSGERSREYVLYLKNQQAVVAFLEQNLASGSNVFQYPVQQYPEVGASNAMQTYEQMLLYLLSRKLNFSYGNCRGRPESQWQMQLPQNDPRELCQITENYGFSALVVYTNALNSADQTWRRWERKPDFTSPRGDIQVFLLKPSATVQPPPKVPCFYFGSLFYEGIGVLNLPSRICQGYGKIHLLFGNIGAYDFVFRLSVGGGSACRVAVLLDNEPVWMGEAPSGNHSFADVSIDLSNVKAGNHDLAIVSEVPTEIRMTASRMRQRSVPR